MDGGLKIVGASLSIIKILKVYRQITTNYISCSARLWGRESITKLGVLEESRWSLLGEQIEVRNRLSYKPRTYFILMSYVCLQDRSARKNSSWKHEKSIWAERFSIPSLLHYSLYRSGVSEQRSWFYLLSCFVSGAHLPFWRGELLVLGIARRTILTLLSRWKLKECHKDKYRF